MNIEDRLLMKFHMEESERHYAAAMRIMSASLAEPAEQVKHGEPVDLSKNEQALRALTVAVQATDRPFTLNQRHKDGMFNRRHELCAALRNLSYRQLDALTRTAVEEGRVEVVQHGASLILA